MKMLKDISVSKNLLLAIILATIYTLAWFEQSVVIFSWDVSWLAEASRRMLAGGSYTKDFFENNPPLILYLYAPPVLLAKWLNMNIIITMRIYVYLIASISLYLCYTQARVIFKQKDSYLNAYLICLLAALFLLFPFADFGQREHFFIMMIMPYLFLMTARLEGHQVKGNNAVCIGVFSAFGFLIKPIFLLAFMAVELIYLFKDRKFSSIIRIETVCLLLLLSLYLAITFYRHADYLNIVLPYALRWCYMNIDMPWEMRIFNLYVVYPTMVLIFAALILSTTEYKSFITILMTTLLSLIVIYALQGSYWYYRIYPMLILATLLSSFVFIRYIAGDCSRRDYIVIMFIAALTLANIWYYDIAIWIVPVLTPIAYLVFCFCLLSCFVIALPMQVQVMAKIIISLIFSYLLLVEVNKSEWSNHQFIIVCLVMLGLFCFFIQNRRSKRLKNSVVIVSMFVLYAPLLFIASKVYTNSLEHKISITKISEYLDRYAYNKSVYFFSTDLQHVSAINYAKQTKLASRFSHFIGLGGIVTDAAVGDPDRNLIVKMLTDDLEKSKPDLVLVEITENKRSICKNEMVNHKWITSYIPFDYLKFFSTDKAFNNIWHSYQYKENILNGRYAVYQYKFPKNSLKDKRDHGKN